MPLIQLLKWFHGTGCADSIGTYQYPVWRTNGFHARRCVVRRRKPIIALNSTNEEWRIQDCSLLRPVRCCFHPCAVHYVVTEFGVAYLFERTWDTRCCIMHIAHPSHREWLEKISSADLVINFLSRNLKRFEVGYVKPVDWYYNSKFVFHYLHEVGRIFFW